MSSAKYSPVSVTEQPRASNDLPMYLKAPSMVSSEKGCHGHDHSCSQQDSSDSHRHRCHNGRLRRFLIPFIVALLLLGGLLAFSCASGHGAGEWGLDTLMSRAIGDTTSGSTGSGSTFVNRKLYLIIVFVGLLVVVILAVMLSAWCCRGAFENPCCCPCYLCACCGGLACLECIGCGLCAEGISQA
ncbi:hypothetical protein BJ912DRAFT_545355 [Pholiota molesta]|nr:hypothetical protein BJ912DRAFT_545355 [Pholiota molesta]